MIHWDCTVTLVVRHVVVVAAVVVVVVIIIIIIIMSKNIILIVILSQAIIIMPRPDRAETLSDDMCLTSVCLSVAYIGPKSRTERPVKIKIGTEVGHVTRDSDTTFRVKRSKVNLQGQGISWLPPAPLVLVGLHKIVALQVLFILQFPRYRRIEKNPDFSYSATADGDTMEILIRRLTGNKLGLLVGLMAGDIRNHFVRDHLQWCDSRITRRRTNGITMARQRSQKRL